MLAHKRNYVIFLLLFLIACSIEKATIPSYVYIKKFKITTNPLIMGDTTQDIQDVWLYQNNEFKGSFGLPTYIPLTEKSKQNLVLRAGVKRTGQDDQRLQYPMFTDFDTILPLADLRSDTIQPRVTYLNNCKFPMVQDFDGAVNFFAFDKPKAGDSVIKVTDQQAWKLNNNSAKFVMSDSTFELNYLSKELSNLPANGIPIYLEVDYKCSSFFIIGLNVIYTDGKTRAYSVFTANSSNGLWKKVYVDLATEISSEIGRRGAGTKFQIFFNVEKSGEPLTDNTKLFLDNIKLIHF